jgi:hypothetical protein
VDDVTHRDRADAGTDIHKEVAGVVDVESSSREGLIGKVDPDPLGDGGKARPVLRSQGGGVVVVTAQNRVSPGHPVEQLGRYLVGIDAVACNPIE